MATTTIDQNRRWPLLLGHIAGFIALAGLVVLSHYRLILYHLVVGLFCVVTASCVFVLALNTRRYHQTGFLLQVGTAFVYMAAFDLLYLIINPDFGIFRGIPASVALNFWIGARWIEGIGLMIAVLLSRRRIPLLVMVFGYGSVSALFVMLIVLGHLPVELGNSVLATVCRWLIYGSVPIFMLITVSRLPTIRDVPRRTQTLLRISIILSLISYTLWILGGGSREPLIMAAQMVRIGSIYLIYRAILRTGIIRPFDLLFRDLKIKELSLQEARNRLEQRVKARTAELTTSNEQLNREISERISAEAALRQREMDLQQLTRRLVTLQEDERLHLSRELHDEAGQALTALKLELEMVAEDVGDTGIRDRIARSADLVEQTMNHLRHLAYGLRPPALDTLGLETSLQDICQDYGDRMGIPIRLTGEIASDPPDEISISAYRILQEALTNVARHARATCVLVDLDTSCTSFRMRINDDGVGFDPTQTGIGDSTGGLGLKGVRERVDQLGGRFELVSSPGEGVSLCVQFAWEGSDDPTPARG